ncbi:DEAD/DEAH box helicase [Marinicella meishanensis]|uniref:DEAD/DEAH box helicase n=1 Tax=Marinicella meishanensis TaxID=2873263 RepID=UPI001CBBCEB1|nr:DEAD/DEAH box helicase [Marinicella sp. NBU2979]
MLKTPISFKGPAGLIQRYFSEHRVFQATQWLLQGRLSNWQHNEVSQTSRALIDDPQGTQHAVSMTWPLPKVEGAEPLQPESGSQSVPWGQCDCTAAKPCVHLAALTIHNKYTLDRLSPFTQQVKALQDINRTFSDWLQQQRHDPFPNMARHRVVYVLDETEDQRLRVSLHKAYLSQDDRYRIKSDLDSSLYFKKNPPKFLSDTDRHIFYQINQHGLAQIHRFIIDPQRDDGVLDMMLQSGRCFWKAVYRAPLQRVTVSAWPEKRLQPWSSHLAFSLQSHVVYRLMTDTQSPANPQDLSQHDGFQPILTLTSEVLNLPWRERAHCAIDVAQISYRLGAISFDLNDLSQAQVQLSAAQIEQVSAANYQVEKLPSMMAEFEPSVTQFFHINDRHLGDDFVAIAPMLLALQQSGWDIHFAPEYRLNHQQVDQWYIEVNNSQGARDAGWFDLKVGVEVAQQQFNLMPFLIKAIKSGAFNADDPSVLIQLDDGLMVGVDPAQLQRIIETIAELYTNRQSKDHLSVSENQLLALVQTQHQWQQTQDAAQAPVRWMPHELLYSKIQALQSIKQLPPATVPRSLQADLRPYQQQGHAWLCFLATHGFHGLLADDMGLGKTLQTLAFILTTKQQHPDYATSLVVAPTSLLGNWQNEVRQFTPDLKVGILAGANREDLYDQFDRHDLLISSYGTVSRDYQQLKDRRIHVLVLDEAQAIKNRRTQVAQTIKQLNARHRLCLSGTPVENHLGELWSIFDFLMPGFLGQQQQFQRHFQWPIEKDNNPERLAELQTRVAPFILRRSKAEVAKELPDKNEIVKYIDLGETQAAIYESIRLSMVDEIRQAMQQQQHNALMISNALLRLRQVCCDPRLLPAKTHDLKANSAQSAKMNWLSTALQNLVEEGRRVLVFSSFAKMLTLISDHLQDMGLGHLLLTGKTPAAQRTADIAAFQAGEQPIYLISLKAGGAGINLTAADTVIHFDPWWNPAAEQQASDRAHRIGQDKQVFVYKLISRGTVEEKIHQLQQQKQQLADELLASQSDIGQILSEHQWQKMLSPIEL